MDSNFPMEKGLDFKGVIALHLNRLSILSFECCQGPEKASSIFAFRSGVRQLETLMTPFMKQEDIDLKAEIDLRPETLMLAQSKNFRNIIMVFEKLQQWQELLIVRAYERGLLEAKRHIADISELDE